MSYKESFQDANRVLHIVMGYCEGGDLCSRLKSFHGQLLAEARVVEWFVQIALALQVSYVEHPAIDCIDYVTYHASCEYTSYPAVFT